MGWEGESRQEVLVIAFSCFYEKEMSWRSLAKGMAWRRGMGSGARRLA